ncbi:MAG: EAL domain-containing protein [Xanthomonadales bacterium]|nr:EAL domain-containing protein [Xanthomonadales bacterium]
MSRSNSPSPRALADPERSAQIMTALRARGVQVWLDDFGTGHSNLAQLLRLPLDAIKLDRTLLSAAPVDLRRRALIAGAVRIARELGLATVAEGVETPEEIRFARDCGFALLQGHAIARPQAEMLAPPPAAELLAAAAARKIL